MDTPLQVTTERIDDIVLLLHTMMRLELPAILDRHLPRHWLQQGLSWGWVATIWLAHILSQGDHRKLPVREWVRQTQETLERVTGVEIRDTDFTDDRLTIVLRELSQPVYWQAIEQTLGQQTVRVHALPQQRVRLDATTVSGYHTGGEESLFQFGKSKDDPTLRQVKVMLGTLDPLGLPLAMDVVSGEQADDGLYVPLINRLRPLLPPAGLVFVGDCKLSALATRAHIHHVGHHYLTPLALVGETARAMPSWIQAAVEGAEPLTPITTLDAEGEEVVLGYGYETTRACTATLEGETISWSERVLIVKSEAYAQTRTRGLEKRLAKATAKLHALTPPRGRGRRQITEEAQLQQAAQAILHPHRVEGLLTYTFERQVEQRHQLIGRGRGGPQRPQQVLERVRYQLTAVAREEAAIATLTATFGWRAYATDVPAQQLALAAAVLTYRAEWVIERGFHRLKGVPLSLHPLFVQRDDQVVGLTHLLSLAVRLLTLTEFHVRRALQREHAHLRGLHPENPKKATATPTAERLLQAFTHITLTIMHFPDRLVRHLTPLTVLQVRILELLDFSPNIYHSLVVNSP